MTVASVPLAEILREAENAMLDGRSEIQLAAAEWHSRAWTMMEVTAKAPGENTFERWFYCGGIRFVNLLGVWDEHVGRMRAAGILA